MGIVFEQSKVTNEGPPIVQQEIVVCQICGGGRQWCSKIKNEVEDMRAVAEWANEWLWIKQIWFWMALLFAHLRNEITKII